MAQVFLTVAEGVARLVIDNPAKRNALDLAMIRALGALVADVAADRSVRVVVVEGAGGVSFTTGVDLDVLTGGDDSVARLGEVEAALEAVCDGLRGLTVPVIAALRGHCMGGGVQLALACDLRLGSTSLSLGIPAIRMAIIYPVSAITAMIAQAGAGAAKALLMGGGLIDAAEALRLRLVDRLIDDGAFEAELAGFTAQLAAQPPGALTAYKRVIDALAAGQPGQAAALRQAAHQHGEFAERIAKVRASRSGKKGPL